MYVSVCCVAAVKEGKKERKKERKKDPSSDYFLTADLST
jgi:hypothetical protein